MPGRLVRYGLRSDNSSEYFLNLQKELPGPGSYGHLDTIGAINHKSSFMTSRMPSIPKAQDRFRAPTEIVKSPSPDSYSPKASIGFDVSSRQPKVQRTKFGNDKTDILDLHFSMKRA